MRVVEITGVVIVLLLGVFAIVGMIGDAVDAAWGLTEVAADLMDWLRERRSRKRASSN